MISEIMEIVEGTKFYLVPSGRYQNPRYVTVAKVGRKWLTLSDGQRADKETLKIDHRYGSPDTLYASQQVYEDSKEHRQVWLAFQDAVSRTYRPTAPKFDIERAAAILGIELKTVKNG